MKTEAQVEIASLSLSWLGPQKFKGVHFTRGSLFGTLDELLINAPFWSFSGPFQLKNGTVNEKITNIEGEIDGKHLNLTGKIAQGSLSLQGTIESKKHFDIALQAKNFPTEVIDPKLSQIAGLSLDLSGTVSNQELQIDASAPNFKTKIRGNITPTAITLKEPLSASFKITPEASALLLKGGNPLFITSMNSRTTATLQIETEGFSFPLPYSFEKLQIKKGTLDLGQVKCRNGKSVATLLSFFKESLLANEREVNGWFTPVDFSLQQGRLTMGRMDVLIADRVHVCSWGQIDWIKDRVDMILGIPADTLESSFGIRNLSKNYVLKVEVRGTTEEPEIVKGPAAAKIAALIAASQVPKKGVLGGIAELFSSPKEERDVPPAKRPFPWEN